jgi:hypothetical protein
MGLVALAFSAVKRGTDFGLSNDGVLEPSERLFDMAFCDALKLSSENAPSIVRRKFK